MKTQINNWRRLTIAFTVLTFLAVLNACKEKRSHLLTQLSPQKQLNSRR